MVEEEDAVPDAAVLADDVADVGALDCELVEEPEPQAASPSAQAAMTKNREMTRMGWQSYRPGSPGR